MNLSEVLAKVEVNPADAAAFLSSLTGDADKYPNLVAAVHKAIAGLSEPAPAPATTSHEIHTTH